MKVINLGETCSILNEYVARLRDKQIQKDRFLFRHNLERIGLIFGYELSKELHYSEKAVATPLGTAMVPTPDDRLVLATILRAGLPLHKGLLEVFDGAESAFVAAYRKYDRGDSFHINIEYCTAPPLAGKLLLLSDTMLATGASMEIAYNRLCEEGEPDYTHIVCPISSVFAVEFLQKRLPKDRVTLWTAALDEELTSHSYIVPGLGDAGDLAFGEKI